MKQVKMAEDSYVMVMPEVACFNSKRHVFLPFPLRSLQQAQVSEGETLQLLARVP